MPVAPLLCPLFSMLLKSFVTLVLSLPSPSGSPLTLRTTPHPLRTT